MLCGTEERDKNMKVVINGCYGGFSISKECAEFMAERGHEEAAEMLKHGKFYGYFDTTERHDSILVEAVEALGEKADGGWAALRVVDIPAGVDYTIEEYDGMEHVAEKHRTWY